MTGLRARVALDPGVRYVQAIDCYYESFEDLARALDEAEHERELVLPTRASLRDGQWLLVTFRVASESVAVAGRVVVDEGEFRVCFEARDWLRICKFAQARCAGCADHLSVPAVQMLDQAPPRCHVLVVDDDAGVQTVVSATLNASGFRARAVGSAEEALDYMRATPVDLLVLDWRLPGMNGLELCRRVKSPEFGQLPVLFLTAQSSESDITEALRAGADDFVAKPFRALELGARVLSLLSCPASDEASP